MSAGADGGNDEGGSDGAASTEAAGKEVSKAQQRRRTKKKSKPPEADGGSGSAAAATTTTASRGDGDGHEELQQQQQPGKRPRLVWTTELHDKFVRAFRRLGRDAVPKKILAMMNINGLTRENIASHLQKYRYNLTLRGRGQGVRRRGNGRVAMMHHRAQPLLQAAFPQAPAPALLPPLNPPPQGPFATLDNMSLAQVIGGHISNILHQLPDLPVEQPVPHGFYRSPQLQAAAIQRRKIIMQQEAQHAAMVQQAAAASGCNPVLVTDYSLGAQAVVGIAPAAAPCAVRELRVQASQAADMNGECSAPEAVLTDEQTETRVAQLQISVVEAGDGQDPAAEPALAGSGNLDNGGQEEGSCNLLDQFWNDEPEPSM